MLFYKCDIEGDLDQCIVDNDDFASDDYLDKSYAVVEDGFFLSGTVEFQLYERTSAIKPECFYEYILIVGNNVSETIVFDNILFVMIFFTKFEYTFNGE